MALKYLIDPHKKDLGGFHVRRLLPYAKQQMVGPWIFFDHMGPAEFPAGKGVNVRPHPHINLATVTYLFEGEILHRDSLGYYQPIKPGDINLMVAGKGIVHSERERDEVRNRPHKLNGLQLWHALPEGDEECDPAFYHYPSDDIPCFNEANVEGRVLMGDAYGVASPVKTFAKTLYVEARLDQGDALTTPKAEQLAVYIVSGEVTVDDQVISANQMAILEDNSVATVQAKSETQLAFIGGEKLTKRYLEWNFVSSQKERIEQAKQDWRNQSFPKVPGDEDEFIPLP
jgi:redox-sensitive bicupin YhaK (pirin superfamily)